MVKTKLCILSLFFTSQYVLGQIESSSLSVSSYSSALASILPKHVLSLSLDEPVVFQVTNERSEDTKLAIYDHDQLVGETGDRYGSPTAKSTKDMDFVNLNAGEHRLHLVPQPKGNSFLDVSDPISANVKIIHQPKLNAIRMRKRHWNKPRPSPSKTLTKPVPSYNAVYEWVVEPEDYHKYDEDDEDDDDDEDDEEDWHKKKHGHDDDDDDDDEEEDWHKKKHGHDDDDDDDEEEGYWHKKKHDHDDSWDWDNKEGWKANEPTKVLKLLNPPAQPTPSETTCVVQLAERVISGVLQTVTLPSSDNDACQELVERTTIATRDVTRVITDREGHAFTQTLVQTVVGNVVTRERVEYQTLTLAGEEVVRTISGVAVTTTLPPVETVVPTTIFSRDIVSITVERDPVTVTQTQIVFTQRNTAIDTTFVTEYTRGRTTITNIETSTNTVTLRSLIRAWLTLTYTSTYTTDDVPTTTTGTSTYYTTVPFTLRR